MTQAAAKVEACFPGTQVVAFGHLGDGNVHFNVMAPAGASPEWIRTEAPAITEMVHDLVTAAGGSISAEHGIGQMRLGELARLGDPARLGAMRAIKQAIDPYGIMNPGKLVPPSSLPRGSLAE
jgi:FAD/FMN-containing dehydrogenase